MSEPPVQANHAASGSSRMPRMSKADRRAARAFDGWLTTRIRAAAARRRKAAGADAAERPRG